MESFWLLYWQCVTKLKSEVEMASLKFQPLLIVSLICSSKDNFLCFLYFLWSEWVIAKRLAGYCNSKDETFASLLCWISFKPNKIHFLFFKFHSGNARYPQLVYYYNNNNNLLQYRFRRCWSTPLYESHPISLWSLQITITLTESALLIFLQSRIEKLLVWAGDWADNLRSMFSQSGAYDLSAAAIPLSTLY